jgi:hypothetical protein
MFDDMRAANGATRRVRSKRGFAGAGCAACARFRPGFFGFGFFIGAYPASVENW